MKQWYGFVWPPGENPFTINPEGKRISLFVSGDIPYVRAGSQKSIAHDDELAATIKTILEQGKEENSEKALNAVAATVDAAPGEEEGPDGPAEEYSPDFIPDEAPGEEVPAEEAGRPPDPPDEGDRHAHDDDEREIEVEGDGAPTRKAKVGTLKAEAKTLAHLCTHRYRNPYCEACIRAKMKHYRTLCGAFKRELKSWGDPTAPAKPVHQRVHQLPLRRRHMHPTTQGALGTIGNLHRPPGAPIKGRDGSGTPGPVSGRGTDRFCISLSRQDNTAF